MVLRVVAKNMEESINERFKYFTEKIVPQFIGDNMDHTLIFVPNYLEYVKVRNWFKASDRDFCEISEYRYILYSQVPRFAFDRKLRNLTRSLFVSPASCA